MRATIYGISGCTNAGKTTISKNLIKKITDKNLSVGYICQDDYFKPKESVRRINGHYHYDERESINEDDMLKDVQEKSLIDDVVIIEGNMLCELPPLLKLLDHVLFMTLDEDECRRRRKERVYDPPDTPNYFDDILWPSYQKHLKNATSLKNEADIKFISGNDDFDKVMDNIYTIFENTLEFLIRIETDELETKIAEDFVVLPQCGAISTFVGTTRKNFKDKTVLSLEYECYESMAYSELRKVCKETKEKFINVERIAVMHRIGKVDVGKASVIISTSSPHRKDAIQATAYAIDILKARVPIFKKEVYSDGTTSWKENCEFHELENEMNNACGDC